MSDPFDADDDVPLIEGLSSVPSSAFEPYPVPSDLRERLLAATGRRVRATRALRRGVAFLVLMATFAAGHLSATWLARERETAAEFPGRPPSGTEPLTSAPGGDPRRLLAEVRGYEQRLPEVSLDEPARLLKEAGDGFLIQEADVGEALRCYEQHLEILASIGTVEVEPGDTWLWTALKHARN